MKWRRFNRSLALLLSVVMAFSLQVGGGGIAFAGEATNVIENTTTGVRYADVETALSAAADGQTVALISDVSLGNAVTYSRPGVGVTLDLNGYRMVREVYGGGETGTDGAVYVSAGVLTIRDTSAAADGYIDYINNAGYSGSGLNLGAGGTVKLLSGGILGTGQSVFAHDADSRFEMSGGVVYGSGAHSGSEAIAAVSGAYVTISGGYIGTKNPDAAMIWSGAALDPAYWSITGGYFTSKYYSDGGQKEIANFVTQGQVTELDVTQTYAAISGATEYKYHLTMPRTIAFDGNGGDSPVATLVTNLSGKLDALPGAAVKSGAEFIGWFTAAAGGEQVTADYIFNRDMTVYAQYRGPGIDYKTEQLSGLTPGAGYKLTDASSVTGATYVTADASGKIAIEEAWLSGTWSLEEGTEEGTPAWSIGLPPRPAAPTGVNAGSVSEAGAADGKLTGLNVNMQYRIKGTGPWITATGPAATGLESGTYEVRTAATTTSFASAAIEVTVGVMVPPALTAVGDNENNLVKLNWTSSLAGQEYYMVYQRDTGGDGLDEFQSIPLKNDIKVLNVYPDMPGSDGLQNWMSTWGNPSGYTMQVDKVSMSDFNGDDPATNYTHYLAKDESGAYAYDVLYFGAWDANNRRDLSEASHEAVEAFIRYGGGVLMGHDTASFYHEHLIDLATKYLNLDVKFQEGYYNPDIPTTGGTKVVVQRRGFPMNYPYALGDVGTILSVPQSHSYFQFAKGDVWFKYAFPDWGSTQEINTYNGKPGTNNFYLTTWNNAALIQTGHSNGSATEDEQKILANTLFYLAQTSTSNSFDDRMSQDVAAPDPVSGQASLTYDSASGRPVLTWNEPKDNGSSYAYYLKATSYVDGSSRQSSETTATVTTGVQGYAVTVDIDPEGNDPGNTVTTATYSYAIPGTLDRGVTYYAHIKTIDRAGNISQVYTLPFNSDASGLTAVSTDPAGKSNDGKTKLSVLETVMPGNRLVYLNVKDGSVEIPAVGEELSGYADIPSNGLVEAANGDKIAVAEVDASGKVVRFGQTAAKVLPAAAALPVASVDPAGIENNGKTQMVAGAGSGNKLVYVNFGKGEITEPSQGELLTGYTDLPDGGIIAAEWGDKIGIAEVDADGKVVRYGVAEAKVSAEAEAKGLSAAATDPSGSGTEGKTRVSASAASGNKLVYVNFKDQQASIPDTGSSLEGLGYAGLPSSGLVDAGNGDLLGIAEVDPSGKVVRYVTVPAEVAPESAAKGLSVGAKRWEGSGAEGKTQLTANVGAGNKLVYMNFGEGPVTAPAAGQPAGSGYAEVQAGGVVEAKNGDLLGVAEVDEQGNVVRFGTTRAVVAPEAAAKGLPVVATDPGGSGAGNQTKLVSKAGEGNRLVYVNFGEGAVNVPGVGETLSGYTEVPGDGRVEAKAGDRIGIAEIGPDGKVVKYGVTEAVVVPANAAKPLTAVSTDPTGAETDGQTKVTLTGAAVGSGNKLVYMNAGKGAVRVPENGAVLSGYSELPENGLIDARNGDNLAIAEVDASGKVVRFAAVKAVVEAEDAAKGLDVSATDPAGEGTDGQTKLASQTAISPGNKRVYLNFGKDGVQQPSVGDTLNGYLPVPEDGMIAADDGDYIGVAEIDASGKVVKYGVATAKVTSDSAADGLTVTSADPAGTANDGKTLVSAKAEAGNTLLYVNFGQGQLLTPDKGVILTGYSALPENGLIAAKEGDRIAVAEVDASGRVVRFGWVTAVVTDEPAEEPPVENPPTPTPTPVPTPTGAPAPGGAPVPAATATPAASAKPNTRGVEVLVNGKVEYAGIATITTENQQVLTTIDVDQAKLQAKLDAEGRGAVVTIPWTAASDIVVAQLTGQMIKNMEDKEALLVLDTPSGAYKIPAAQIRMATLAAQFGSQVKLDEVTLQVHIALGGAEAAKAGEAQAAKQGATLIAAPVTFTVNAVYAGKSIEIKDYSVYVERTVALPQGIDPNKITTGVVLEPDGTLRHVPTKVTKVNDVYYAQINSLTNSDYGVVWHPLEFTDVAAHWSEAAVNDMGSRLVINGVGEGTFRPNADITRAEFAAIMVRGLGLRLEQGAAPFSDVDSSQWYASAVNTAYRMGLISGYEDNTFRPQGKITRQEAMTMTARAMSITGLKAKVAGADAAKVLQPYKDASAVAGWAKEAAAYSVASQVMKGRTASSLNPQAFITRAEVAAVIQRLLQQSGLI